MGYYNAITARMRHAMISSTELPSRTDLSMAVKEFVNLADVNTDAENRLCIRTVGPSHVVMGVESARGNAKSAWGGVFFGRKLFENKAKAIRISCTQMHKQAHNTLGSDLWPCIYGIDSQRISSGENVLCYAIRTQSRIRSGLGLLRIAMHNILAIQRENRPLTLSLS